MNLIPFDITTGTWVDLVAGDDSGVPQRWPGPHRPGEVIHASGGSGCFCLDRFKVDSGGTPVAVYRWIPTSRAPHHRRPDDGPRRRSLLW
jgi:hypothetical protein